MSVFKSALFFTSILALSSCDDNSIVRGSVEVDPSGWSASEPAVIEFDLKEAETELDMFVDLRHNGDYPYRNLFLFMALELPDGNVEKDTIECLLADRMGHWLGSGNGFIFENSIDHKVLFRYKDRSLKAGKYKLIFEQAMRTDQLIGVMDIGLTISPSVK